MSLTKLFEGFKAEYSRIEASLSEYVPLEVRINHPGTQSLPIPSSSEENLRSERIKTEEMRAEELEEEQIQLKMKNDEEKTGGKWGAGMIEKGADLMQVILDFLESPAERVALIYGGPGSGKTMFGRYLEGEMWKKVFVDGNPGNLPEDRSHKKSNEKKPRIPIYIRLVLQPHPTTGLPGDILKARGLSDFDVHDLKAHYPILLILDGYDEISTNENLFKTNCLASWKDIKVIITCRPGYSNTHFEAVKFGPVATNASHVARHSLVRLHINPLSSDKTGEFIKSLQASVRNSLNYDAATLKGIFEKLKLIDRGFFTSPLILRLFWDSLQSPSGKQKVDARINSGSKRPILLSEVFDLYLEKWFEKQGQKLQSSQTLDWVKKCMAEFSCQLGVWMLIEQKQQLKQADEKPFSFFFGSDDDQATVIGRQGAPISTFEGCYLFDHRAFREYFAAKYMIAELLERQALIPTQAIDNSFAISQRLLIREPLMLHFLADQLILQPALVDVFYRVIEATRMDPSCDFAGANVISALSLAGMSIKDQDFSGINVPNADFNNAILESVNFRFSNLCYCSLIGAKLFQIKLDYANLDHAILSVKIPLGSNGNSGFSGSILSLFSPRAAKREEEEKEEEAAEEAATCLELGNLLMGIKKPNLILRQTSFNGVIGLSEKELDRLATKNGGPTTKDFFIPKELLEKIFFGIPFKLDPAARHFNIQTAFSLTQLSVLAYQPENQIKQVAEGHWGFPPVKYIVSEKQQVRCCLLKKDNQVVVAFRGTDNIRNFLVDLDTAKSFTPVLGGKVHRGFFDALESVWDELKQALLQEKALSTPSSPITFWFTGHSLGAALAMLTVAKCVETPPEGGSPVLQAEEMRLYTVGQPRCGDEDFAQGYNKSVRHSYPIFQKGDPIPCVPPHSWPFGYCHPEVFRFLDEKGLLYFDQEAREIDWKKDMIEQRSLLDTNPQLTLKPEEIEKRMVQVQDTEQKIRKEVETESEIVPGISMGDHSSVSYLKSLKNLLDNMYNTKARMTPYGQLPLEVKALK